MQLYRIHENPAENASLIGVYANKINVAEGLQQISDIGHCLGITWPGQYKASYVRTAHGTGRKYVSHPLVMGHMRERQTFLGLCSVVEESLDWLEDNGHEKWCSKRRSVWESLCESGVKYIADALPDHRTPFEFQAEYLVNIKRFDASGKALVTDEEARIIQEEVLTNDTEGGAMIEVSKERFDARGKELVTEAEAGRIRDAILTKVTEPGIHQSIDKYCRSVIIDEFENDSERG